MPPAKAKFIPRERVLAFLAELGHAPAAEADIDRYVSQYVLITSPSSSPHHITSPLPPLHHPARNSKLAAMHEGMQEYENFLKHRMRITALAQAMMVSIALARSADDKARKAVEEASRQVNEPSNKRALEMKGGVPLLNQVGIFNLDEEEELLEGTGSEEQGWRGRAFLSANCHTATAMGGKRLGVSTFELAASREKVAKTGIAPLGKQAYKAWIRHEQKQRRQQGHTVAGFQGGLRCSMGVLGWVAMVHPHRGHPAKRRREVAEHYNARSTMDDIGH